MKAGWHLVVLERTTADWNLRRDGRLDLAGKRTSCPVCRGRRFRMWDAQLRRSLDCRKCGHPVLCLTWDPRP